jgi:hypothetical protein
MKNMVIAILALMFASTLAVGQTKNTCDLMSKAIVMQNQMIATGTVLTVNYKSAMQWEAINPSNPEAAAMRAKIDREEIAFSTALHNYLPIFKTLDPNIGDTGRQIVACPRYHEFSEVITEFTDMVLERSKQATRYHALGY